MTWQQYIYFLQNHIYYFFKLINITITVNFIILSYLSFYLIFFLIFKTKNYLKTFFLNNIIDFFFVLLTKIYFITIVLMLFFVFFFPYIISFYFFKLRQREVNAVTEIILFHNIIIVLLFNLKLIKKCFYVTYFYFHKLI